ncbi:MAG TPA: hypothetical protein VK708_03920 [Bryobacteraceae bacterium]|nr:hypothetical protein [Bryobacteraceae bacterium]
MFCRERDRLFDIHVAVVAKNAEEASAIAQLKGTRCWSDVWWKAIREARERYHASLEDLNRHQAKHGC